MAWPILSSSHSACQTFHWRHTLGPEKGKPEPNEKLRSLQAESVGSVQNSIPNFPDACRIGANRSEVVDVDRQHGRVKTWLGQVVLQHKTRGRHERLETGWSGRKQEHASNCG